MDKKSGAVFIFDENAALKKITDNVERGRLRLAERVLDDGNIFIPVDTGLLRSTGRVEDNGAAVTWNTPYGQHVYYPEETGIHIHTDKNPNATGHWFEVAKNLKVEEWLRVMATEILK